MEKPCRGNEVPRTGGLKETPQGPGSPILRSPSLSLGTPKVSKSIESTTENNETHSSRVVLHLLAHEMRKLLEIYYSPDLIHLRSATFSALGARAMDCSWPFLIVVLGRYIAKAIKAGS